MDLSSGQKKMAVIMTLRLGFTATGMILTQQSPPMPRKNLARMAAALFACEELHKRGELDDYLLPVCSLSDEESELEEEEGESGGKKKKKAGTKKRRRRYGRKVRCCVSRGIISDYARILKSCFRFCSFGLALPFLRRAGLTSAKPNFRRVVVFVFSEDFRLFSEDFPKLFRSFSEAFPKVI